MKVAKDARLRITRTFQADDSVTTIDRAYMQPHIDAALADE